MSPVSRKRAGRGGGMPKKIFALFRDERGSVFIFMTVFLLMMLFSLGLVADLGSLHYCRARLQDAADAAALAAAGKALESGSGEQEARDEALQYIQYYGLGTAEDPPAEDWFVYDAGSRRITVTVAAEAPMYFSRIFGAETVTLGAQACARWDPEGVSLAP